MSTFIFSRASTPPTTYLSYILPSTWQEVIKKELSVSSKPNAWTLFNTWRIRQRVGGAGNVVKAYVKKNRKEWSSFPENDPVKLHFERLAEGAQVQRMHLSDGIKPSKRSHSDIKKGKENIRPKKKAKRSHSTVSTSDDSFDDIKQNLATGSTLQPESNDRLVDQAFTELGACEGGQEPLNDNGIVSDLLGKEILSAAEEELSNAAAHNDLLSENNLSAGGNESPKGAIVDDIVEEATSSADEEPLTSGDALINSVEMLAPSQEGLGSSFNLQQSETTVPAVFDNEPEGMLERLFNEIIDVGQMSEDTPWE